MSYTQRIGQHQWDSIYMYLNDFANIYTKNEADCRRFVEAVF